MKSGMISIDQQKYNRLATQNVLSQNECQNCFLKWHCGGGCIAHRLLHDDVIQQISCESSRDLFRKLLVQNWEFYVHDEYGCSLIDFLRTGGNV